MTKNQLQYWADQETHRANLARESENYRHNYETEAETRRSNLAREALGLQQLEESKRSNRVRELETSRSNLASESIRRDSNAISFQGLGETIQHNRMTESTNFMEATTRQMQASEQRRANLANEDIRRVANTNTFVSNAEDERSHRVQEQLTRQSQDIMKEGQLLSGASSIIGTLGNVVARTIASKINVGSSKRRTKLK